MTDLTRQRQILSQIEAIRNSRADNAHYFSNGGCWQFFEILRAFYPEAQPWTDGDHVVTRIDGKLYDIGGTVYEPMGRSEIKTAHRWQAMEG